MDRIASERERQRAIEVARAVLDGRSSTLDAIGELFPLAHTDAIGNEADRLLIIGMYSETHHLPVGDVRQLFAAEALRQNDVEISRAEALWKPELLSIE
jgi:hypothetical protein